MQAQVFFQDQEASRGGPGGRKGPWRLERAKDTMPRLARRVEFVGLMLLGLLPTYAINTHAVQKLDPAAAFAAAAPCARPPRPGRAVAGEPGPALCGARVPQWRSAGRPSGLVRLRCAAANGQHPNGPHAGHVAARNAAHGLQAREKILVTGGAGYIGSHICADLLQKDYDVVVLDNFVNSSPTALQRAMELGGRELTVYEGDTRDLAALRHVFESELTISSVIHLAGLKAVGESVAKPTMYYDFNVAGSINLMQVMSEYNCKKMVFSSSATVYGETTANPIKETEPLGATSPYGRSKLMVEDMLRDQCKADPEWGVAILRYFNPVGAHPSGLLGEDPKGIPNNLMPFITKVATGAQPQLKIFGNDYPTRDGTGVRDYLHVMDLSQGHLAAIEALNKGLTGAEPFNLGTGVGVSVLEMVDAFSKARGAPIPYVIEERRPGDVAECYADSSKALEQLGWKAQCSVDDMCRDVLTWTSKNPEGFGSGVAVAADSVLHAKAPSPAPLRSYVAGTQTSGGKRVSLNARNAPVRVKA